MISQKALKEFKDIWDEEIGTDISEKELFTEATSLLTLLDVTYCPIQRDWVKE